MVSAEPRAINVEHILNKIRKLLSMASDVGSPNEAAIAAGQARKLMDKYQVSLDNLEESSVFDSIKVGKEYRFMPIWKGILSVSIAKFNDCRGVLSVVRTATGHLKQVAFQGHKSDVILAAAMYDYLVSAVDRICAAYIEELGYSKYPAKIGDAYKKAAANILILRLRELQKVREGQIMTGVASQCGTSLVAFKMAAVEAEFGEASYTSIKVSSRRGADVDAAKQRGANDAASINLDTQISGSTAQQAVRGQ